MIKGDGGSKDSNGEHDNVKETDGEASLNSISIKLPLPVLHKEHVELWFIQLECWFTLNKILSDKVKFNTVISCMEPHILSQVFNIVKNPPSELKYNCIKAAIVAAYSDSSQQKFQKLLSGIQLGDGRPSHLLNELRKVGGEISEDILKNLWISRLPDQAKPILAASRGTIEELALIADAIIDSLGYSTATISEVKHQKSVEASTSSSSQHYNNDLQKQISQLNKRINDLTFKKRSSRSLVRERSHSNLREKTPSRPPICWYHRNYGNEAKKCNKPCNFETKQ